MKGHVICCCCVSLKGGISSCMGQDLALITRIVPRLNSSWKEAVLLNIKPSRVPAMRLMSRGNDIKLDWRLPVVVHHAKEVQALIGYAFQQPPARLGTTVQPPAPILCLNPWLTVQPRLFVSFMLAVLASCELAKSCSLITYRRAAIYSDGTLFAC